MALTLTYRTEEGSLGETMLFRQDEQRLSLEGASSWSFDANADDLKLASEAYRIRLAHLFDPYLAVRTSAIDPLPHQISAVYKDMLPKMPLRFVLADDPGAGKTIMTGLLIKEMMARGDLRRCLIVSPATSSSSGRTSCIASSVSRSRSSPTTCLRPPSRVTPSPSRTSASRVWTSSREMTTSRHSSRRRAGTSLCATRLTR